MIRGIVTSVTEGLIKLLACMGRSGETFTNREYFQHYGFTSRPLADAEVIIIKEGNHYVAIASDDRRYRLAVENGEVALYTDEGDKIHMKRNRKIEIVGGEEVDITTKVAKVAASVSADITSPVATVNASTSCTITSPAVTVNASTSCTVNSPSVKLGNGTLRQLVDERLIDTYNNHSHPWGGDPDPQISLADHCTSNTEAS